jgi:hypothetical protein
VINNIKNIKCEVTYKKTYILNKKGKISIRREVIYRMNNLNKLKCIGLLSLFLLIFCFTTISSAETASDLILQEAQNEAAQLEAVRSALLLDYSEKYNQYLSDYKTWIATKTGPEPTEPLIGRDSSGNLSWTGALSYLPSGFGTASSSTLTRSDGVQYTLLATGDFVTVAVSNISAAAAELVPNYMPLASYDSATGKVSLLVTPETSGVAMELLNDVIENYVRRDGAGDPTFYDGATVTLGAGATLEWNNNDGQILGVSLLRGNNLAIQQIDTLSFGTGTLSLSQPSAGQLKIAGAGGSLYVEGPKLSSSTGDLILESSTVIATGEKLYIGDKGGAGTYSMSTANGELKMENSAGYVAFKRTGSQLQVNTDASEIYLTKNLRVSRVIGTADNALHANTADTATNAINATTIEGKSWSDIQNYVQNNAGGGGESILESSQLQTITPILIYDARTDTTIATKQTKVSYSTYIYHSVKKGATFSWNTLYGKVKRYESTYGKTIKAVRIKVVQEPDKTVTYSGNLGTYSTNWAGYMGFTITNSTSHYIEALNDMAAGMYAYSRKWVGGGENGETKYFYCIIPKTINILTPSEKFFPVLQSKDLSITNIILPSSGKFDRYTTSPPLSSIQLKLYIDGIYLK